MKFNLRIIFLLVFVAIKSGSFATNHSPNSIKCSINNPNWQHDALTMTAQNNVIKAIPSSLSVDGKSFTVTWQHE